MADVFISYAREDKPRADQIARAIQAMGFDVFWDAEIPPGRTWADYIESKVTNCKVMVVLWSAASTSSQWVREEARIGRDRGKLIPVMLDNSVAPFGFGEVQSANLSTWSGAGDHPDWLRLLDAVRALAGAPAQPARAAPQAQNFFSPPPASGAPEQLSPIGYVQKCLRLYVNANGRAARAEYWWWFAFAVAVAVVTAIVDLALVGPYAEVKPVSTIASLGLLCPGVCVAVRRFHDAGFSGWLYAGAFAALLVGVALAAAVPALGAIVVLGVVGAMLVVLLMPSKPGANAYGPNPLGR